MGEGLGLVAGPGARDDDGERVPGVRIDIALGGGRRGTHPGSGTVPGRVKRGLDQPVAAGQGFAEREVQVDGAGRWPGLARGGQERLRGECRARRGWVDRAGVLGRSDVTFEPGVRRDQPGLHRGLIAADAAHVFRPVGREQQHRDARVVRLGGRGNEVGDGGAARHDDRCGNSRFLCEPESQKRGAALVNAHVQANDAERFSLGGRKRERLRARSGAHHDVAKAPLDQLRKQPRGEQ